ncbi:MAG: DNRLRE domain-containing protein [Caldilineaceae bacterium]
MSRTRLYLQRMVIWLIVLCTMLPAGLAQAAASEVPVRQEASALQQAATIVALDPTDDARTQAGSPNVNFGEGFLWMGQPNTHFALVKFDLTTLPPDATITAAGLRLDFLGIYTGTNNIEVGQVEGAWDETTVTASTALTYTWSGQFQAVTSTGIDDSSVVTWNVTSLVQAWQAGTLSNDGIVLRGNGGELKAAHSKETGEAGNRGPKLIVAYTLPGDDGQPHPDLGDAPDSTNHHGMNNTAYAIGGVPGQFPTVWDVPAGQVAGPRHANVTMEGWLGDFLSREHDADQGPDQDAPRNNILRNTVTGALGDVADNDRADDGWRNRSLRFFNCRRQTLDVRVSKSPVAARNVMYLNVWFDGNRDGDWADLGQCQPDETQPAQASYEWIVQNYIVDMTSIAPGGSRDFAVLTEKVMNATEGMPHWMRFMLSEEPAVQPPGGGLPDGRGPHPTSPLTQYRYGETEDVLQKPAPAGTPGMLEIQKTVITDGEPVEWIDYVTYEIRLRHAGGTEPMLARLRDVLPYPLIVYPTVDANGIHYVNVESPTGGASPLQAQIGVLPPSGSTPPQQVVNWQGSLAPDAEIKFTFQVRVIALCQAGEQTMTFTNTAQAKPEGGTVTTAADTFTAKCIDYDENSIEFTSQPITPTLDLGSVTDIPWRGTIHNQRPVSVTIGIYQQLPAGQVDAAVADQASSLATTTPLLTQITLGPNETQSLEANWRPALPWGQNTDELGLPDDPTADLGMRFCILPPGMDGCPDQEQYPNLHGSIPFTLTLRPNDLGDAPDSSNHTLGAAGDMPAYPTGVLGNFPTVFDPATGQPQGPRHSLPGPLHLGQFVSREAEADVAPDQDPLTNIIPPADDPDNDGGDDGPIFPTWTFANCQQTVLQTRVAVTQGAVNYFQNLGTQAYLNVWIDANRDGDWADAFMCGQQAAPEHILIDSPVNVVAMGPGLHVIGSQTGLVPWSITDQPAWVRVTLSDRPSNKTLQAGNVSYGDGRGYAQPFRTGETEDFYFRPLGGGGGPDVEVQMAASSRDESGGDLQVFKIDYANIGAAGATRATLEFQIPEKLRGQQPALVKGSDATRESISFNFDRLSVQLPTMAPNTGGSLVLGWYGCITCTLAAASERIDATPGAATVDFAANVKITVPGDVDTSNNEASATARGLLSSPIVGSFMDYTDDACTDRVLYGPVATNKSSIELRGKAAPNSIIAILIGLQQFATVTSDANGSFSYTITLPPGVHRIHAEYANQVGQLSAAAVSINAPRDMASGLPTGQVVIKVDPTLPFDPMSTCFADSKGRSYAVPTLGYSFGATQTGSWLRSGETYAISVNADTGELNRYFTLTFEDVLITSLVDTDGDGTYQGTATFPALLNAAGANAAAATSTLRLIVGSSAGENSYSVEVGTAVDGVISSRATGQPLANASVSALLAQGTSDGSLFYTAGANQPGESNPQVTGADGRYSYSASSGIYRIDVAAAGYQSYRSGDIDAGATSLAQNIALAPAIAEAPATTIYITANGYMPAAAAVAPGSVVEFVNLDLVDHSSTGGSWDSGMLATGQSFKVMFAAEGSYSYGDAANPLLQGGVKVAEGADIDEHIYLPMVRR